MSDIGTETVGVDPFGQISKGHRTMVRNALERQAVHEAMAALRTEGVDAALAVLALYARPYQRLADQ